jgi:hypothetical protein
MKLATALLMIGVLAVGSPSMAAGDPAEYDFLELCADCHGEDARGNGPLAVNLTKVPPDLTQISKRAGGKFDEKAVFEWILGLNMPSEHGTREMPIWGDWLMDEALGESTSLQAATAAEQAVKSRVMALVKYLKKLQGGN